MFRDVFAVDTSFMIELMLSIYHWPLRKQLEEMTAVAFYEEVLLYTIKYK